jgi:hypothetical protein
LALNLPGKDVMLAHDRAFERHELDPNCWTPRVLLQAAEQKSGPEAGTDLDQHAQQRLRRRPA